MDRAYERRAERQADERYALSNPANLYVFQRRERVLLAMLKKHRLLPLAGKRIIDVGCGNGEVLRDFVRYGAEPALLSGVDLLPERIAAARAHSPARWTCARLTRRRCRSRTRRSISLQFTVLSSVKDRVVRAAIARETLRVLRPGGAIAWYDFPWNPRNSDTRGIGAKELRQLYAGCAVDVRRTTLAPPIARRVAPLSLTACRTLEVVPVLRSHLLAIVRR